MPCRRLLLVAPLLLTGCKQQALLPGIYLLGPSAALERLHAADIAGFKQAEHCGLPIDISATDVSARAIRWAVTSGFTEVASFTVSAAPVTPQASRLSITIPPDPQGGEIYDGHQQIPNPALQQPLRPAIQELVDAAIEKRPYDANRVKAQQGLDGVCSIQRSAAEGGSAHFSVSGAASGPGVSTDTVSDSAPFGSPMDVPQGAGQPVHNPIFDGHEGRVGG